MGDMSQPPYRRREQNPLCCEHANECPGTCPCDDNCYCREYTCANKAPTAQYNFAQYMLVRERAEKADAFVAKMSPVVKAAQAMIHANVSHCKEPWDAVKVFLEHFGPLAVAVRDYEPLAPPPMMVEPRRIVPTRPTTRAQLRELRRLSQRARETYGPSIVRVQKNLVAKGLAQFQTSGGAPVLPDNERADYCVITEAGKSALYAAEKKK